MSQSQIVREKKTIGDELFEFVSDPDCVIVQKLDNKNREIGSILIYERQLDDVILALIEARERLQLKDQEP